MLWTSLTGFDIKTINTIGDGSCFFHAILMAFYIPYIKSKNKSRIARQFRIELAKRLSEDAIYASLSNGQLSKLAEEIPMYSLENMKNQLLSGAPVSHLFNEFISNELHKDIYLLSEKEKNVYFTGDDYSLLHKGRCSIVIMYYPGHYELVSVDGQTFFSSEHPFIKAIREKYLMVRK